GALQWRDRDKSTHRAEHANGRRPTMDLSYFAIDTVTLAGSLEEKLRATRAAGFGGIELWAKDVVSHAGGVSGAVPAVRAGGVRAANCPNLGVLVNAFHLLARGTSLDTLDSIPGERIFLVQLADYLGDLKDISETADHRRAFPHESAHRDIIGEMVRKVHA